MNLRKLLSEPLVHFVAMGLLLFGLDRARHPKTGRSEPPPPACAPTFTPGGRIVVTAEVKRLLAGSWTDTSKAPPTSEELDGLVERWIDDEVLYREGMARGLERDDPRVRQRVATKMALVLKEQTIHAEPTDAELRAWFSEHADRWSKSELVDFVHVFVRGDDEAAKKRALEYLTELQAGADPSGMGDSFSGGRHYRRRKIDDLAKAFGDEFVAGMREQPEGRWTLRSSRFGKHLVRIERRTPPQAAEFDAVKADVEKDLATTRDDEALSKAIRELRARWEVVREP